MSQKIFTSSGLPPCLAHDLFEGVVAYNLRLYLNYFVNAKCLTYLDLNNLIQSSKFVGCDASSKPAMLSKNPNGTKVNGSASQIWSLLRFLPVILANKVNTSDSIWSLILQLREITEYATTPKLCPGQVIFMKN